jgi:hypothetical protein
MKRKVTCGITSGPSTFWTPSPFGYVSFPPRAKGRVTDHWLTLDRYRCFQHCQPSQLPPQEEGIEDGRHHRDTKKALVVICQGNERLARHVDEDPEPSMSIGYEAKKSSMVYLYISKYKATLRIMVERHSR